MPHYSIVCVHVINIGGFLKVLLAEVYRYMYIMYFFSVSNTSFLALKYNKKVKCLDHWEFFLYVHYYTLIFIIIYTCNVKKFWIPNECVLDLFLTFYRTSFWITRKHSWRRQQSVNRGYWPRTKISSRG